MEISAKGFCKSSLLVTESPRAIGISLSLFIVVVKLIDKRVELEAISGDSGNDLNVVDGDSAEGESALSKDSSQFLNQVSKSRGKNDTAGFLSMLESCDDQVYSCLE